MEFKRFIRGELQKKVHLKMIGIFLSVFLLLFLISILTYGHPFTMQSIPISSFGDPLPGYNPTGWWVFTICFVYSGIMLIPQYLFVWKRLGRDTKYGNALFLLSLIVGSIGQIGLGIFNESLGISHLFFGIVAVLGAGFAFIISIPIMLVMMFKRRNWPKPAKFAVLYGCVFIFIGTMVSEVMKSGLSGFWNLYFAEWMCFIAIFTWIIGLAFITEDTSENC